MEIQNICYPTLFYSKLTSISTVILVFFIILKHNALKIIANIITYN